MHRKYFVETKIIRRFKTFPIGPLAIYALNREKFPFLIMFFIDLLIILIEFAITLS